MKRCKGTVEKFEKGFWTVVTDHPQRHLRILHLRRCDFKDPPYEGKEVELEYVVTSRSGLWVEVRRQ